ncbi:KR domain-containing protein [Mycobacterium tuberculosis]
MGGTAGSFSETELRGSVNGASLPSELLADAPAVPNWSLDSGVLDDVAVTGGAGAIGMHYARHLAEHGARRIVLLQPARRGSGATVAALVKAT